MPILFRRPGQPAASSTPRRVRLVVEQLEAREVPATTFTVSNLDDAGVGSLRDAIGQANVLLGQDTVRFRPGLSGTIRLTSGELTITDDLTIQGPGSSLTGSITISGNDASRIFHINGSTPTPISVAVSGLTLTKGKVSDINGLAGAILVNAETLTLTGMVITDNHAEGYGGGIYVGGGSLTVENSTVSINSSRFGGGGIHVYQSSLTVNNSTISGNMADGGAGIVVAQGAAATIENSTLSGNLAAVASGGITVFEGSLTVKNSTISGNMASDAAGGIDIFSGSATIENCTLSGNRTNIDGGAILVRGGSVVIRNSTIASNTADLDNSGGGFGGGIVVRAGATVTLHSSIVSDNLVGTSGANPDLSGTVTASNSLVEDTTGTTFAAGSGANFVRQDPRLGPLQNNGGPTRTHALLPGSPAINAGANLANLPTDQRGPDFTRVVGGAADIGAFEAPLPPPTPPAPTPQITAVAFRQKGKAKVRIRDAVSGALRRVLTPFPGFTGRLRLSLRDVNGDGSRDLMVQALIDGNRKKKVFDAVTLASLPPNLAS